MSCRKSQGTEWELSFEKINLAKTCFIRLSMSFIYLSIIFLKIRTSYDTLKIGLVFDHLVKIQIWGSRWPRRTLCCQNSLYAYSETYLAKGKSIYALRFLKQEIAIKKITIKLPNPAVRKYTCEVWTPPIM